MDVNHGFIENSVPSGPSLIYESLDPSLQQIRILELDPSPNLKDPITCHLSIVSFRHLPLYECLSYTWGDSEPTDQITINGRRVNVKPNLHSALQYIRLPTTSLIIWIDALCIDQNNLNEKSEQIPMMGEIYIRATRVYAWLGEADRQTDCVFDILTAFRDRTKEANFATHLDAAEQLSFHRQLFYEIYEEKAGTLPERNDSDDDMLQEEFNWLRPLYTRPYWQRVWIIQELVLAKSVFVFCGDKSIDFDDIYGLSLDWGSFEQGFDTGIYGRVKLHTRGWVTIQTIRGHRRRRELKREIGDPLCLPSFQMSDRGSVAYLDEVIEVYAQHHECSLPKDKVYGFYELVPEWKEKLVVNYNQSDLDVFLDVAKLGLFEPSKHGGWQIAFHLWSAMKLGDRTKFNNCLRGYLLEGIEENEQV